MKLVYNSDSDFLPVEEFTLKGLSFYNVDYYGDAANFMEIVGSEISMSGLNLYSVNTKSFVDKTYT